MALWATDVALQAAATNYTGVYLHTREYGVTYNLFDPPSATDSMDAGWSTGPIYYATLVVAETLSWTGSVVVDLDIDLDNAALYGIYDNAGTTRGKLLFINYASSEFVEDGQSTTRILQIPANVTRSIGVRLLEAPNVTFREPSNPIAEALSDTITWANQTIGDYGDLNGTQYTNYSHCREGCTVSIPGPSIALIYMLSNDSDRFYEGNSSIVGPVLVSGAGCASGIRITWMWLWVGFGLLLCGTL